MLPGLGVVDCECITNNIRSNQLTVNDELQRKSALKHWFNDDLNKQINSMIECLLRQNVQLDLTTMTVVQWDTFEYKIDIDNL